jgi:DHA1 family bicyclomycin/chloramphenicol resistance-like MFS transporter
VDIYSGEKLKHYVSLFSIIWSTAPIIAPFLGGYLQASFGWRSNFYFLGGATVVLGILEVFYGGESLKVFQTFKAKPILEVYASKIKTLDFTVGLFILGLSYLMVIVHGMASPFIVEHVFHYSPVITGYCSLLSGIALMTGGIISKIFIDRPLLKKIGISIPLQLLFIIGMIGTSIYWTNIFTLMTFTILIHMLGGFTFNNVLTFCLGRFTKNAGMTAGIAGGSLYIISSVFSYGIIKQVTIDSQLLIGGTYLGISILLIAALLLFRKFRNVSEAKINSLLTKAA